MLQKNKYPWMVYVRPGNFICGGTLVASKYVVTAAHCLYFDTAATQPMATCRSCHVSTHGIMGRRFPDN